MVWFFVFYFLFFLFFLFSLCSFISMVHNLLNTNTDDSPLSELLDSSPHHGDGGSGTKPSPTAVQGRVTLLLSSSPILFMFFSPCQFFWFHLILLVINCMQVGPHTTLVASYLPQLHCRHSSQTTNKTKQKLIKVKKIVFVSKGGA